MMKLFMRLMLGFCVLAFALSGCATVDRTASAEWDCERLHSELAEARLDEIRWQKGREESFAKDSGRSESARKFLRHTFFKPLDVVYDEEIAREQSRQSRLSQILREKGC